MLRQVWSIKLVRTGLTLLPFSSSGFGPTRIAFIFKKLQAKVNEEKGIAEGRKMKSPKASFALMVGLPSPTKEQGYSVDSMPPPIVKKC